jgi:radical SAM superfamily enzyme YgiQ (UPF0313 family)
MLLVYPPVAKACEPPAGIARLAAGLRANGVPCTLLDANLEGQLFLLRSPVRAADTWTRRAVRNAERNLAALRDAGTYSSPDRYRRAVHDLARLLAVAGRAQGAAVGLADFQHERWSPVRSRDLQAAAEHPEQNPFYPYYRERLTALVERDQPRMIGFSVNFLNQAICAFGMIGFVKQRFPGIPIVLGGGLVTSWMKRPGWNEPFRGLVDHVICGPGEDALLALLGIANGTGTKEGADYGGLPLKEYLAPGVIAPYSGSNGCYWNRCSFCPESAEGNPYLPVPAPRGVAEIKALVNGVAPALLHLLDNSISPALLRALAADQPGAAWYGFARIGTELADPDLCRQLKQSGCAMLKLGLESGDQGVLDSLEKGVDLGTASQVLKNLRAAGIAAYVYLLFGTPPENETAARRTLAFTVGHRDAIDFLNLAVFNMPVCAKDASAYDIEPFSDGDLSLYTGFRHPSGWDRRQVRKFLDTEFIRHPAIAPIVRSDPPAFTSNHAAFFAGR